MAEHEPGQKHQTDTLPKHNVRRTNKLHSNGAVQVKARELGLQGLDIFIVAAARLVASLHLSGAMHIVCFYIEGGEC
jgi:hypothetical protein